MTFKNRSQLSATELQSVVLRHPRRRSLSTNVPHSRIPEESHPPQTHSKYFALSAEGWKILKDSVFLVNNRLACYRTEKQRTTWRLCFISEVTPTPSLKTGHKLRARLPGHRRPRQVQNATSHVSGQKLLLGRIPNLGPEAGYRG